MKYIISAILLLFITGCQNPASSEESILIQRITLDFSSPFSIQTTMLKSAKRYEVRFKGEFYYSLNDTSFISQSGIYTFAFTERLKTGFYFSFPDGTPFKITSGFIRQENLIEEVIATASYSFCGLNETDGFIQFDFPASWKGQSLINTSGLITVEIFMEGK